MFVFSHCRILFLFFSSAYTVLIFIIFRFVMVLMDWSMFVMIAVVYYSSFRFFISRVLCGVGMWIIWYCVCLYFEYSVCCLLLFVSISAKHSFFGCLCALLKYFSI